MTYHCLRECKTYQTGFLFYHLGHVINRTTANASKSLGYLKRNILTKNPAIKEAAYKTIVRPQVEYACSVWSPYTKKDINKIEMVQRRAIRWTQNSYSSYASITQMQNLKLYMD